jgi:YD repeat-containing protein
LGGSVLLAQGGQFTWRLTQVTRYSYDGEGQLTQAVSPANHITKLEWGGYHKLVRRTDPNGNKVRLGYNVEGELTHVWNERGELHRLDYTSAGLLKEEHTFDGRTLSYRHDQASRPIAIRNGAGELTELEYDLAGQLILRKLHDDAEEKFTYSLLGDLVGVEAPSLRLAFQRDALGQIVREEQTYAGQTHAVDLAYDPDGERIRRATSLGHVEEVQRDAAGHRRLTRLDGREIAHAVDLFGRELARQLPGGGRLESSFDALGRLADRRALGPERDLPGLAGQPEHLAPRRTNVSAYKAFRYDADGELVETIDRDRGKTQFRYDPVGQLLSMVPERARAELFRYDKTGNLHEEGAGADKRVYAKGNRLLQKGDTHYTWDRDGRLIEKRTPDPRRPSGAAQHRPRA